MRPPSDLGLPALGLVCQALLHTSVVFGTMFVIGQIARLASAGDRLFAILVLVAGFVRAASHGRVAERMRERSPEVTAAVKRYALIAALTTAVTIAAVAVVLGEMPFGLALTLVLVGLVWPVTLWLLVTRRAVRAAFSTSDSFDVDLVPADRSVEGLGVLVVSFATLGLSLLLTQLPFIFAELESAPPLLMAAAGLTLVMLLGRGVFQLVLGARCMRDLSPARLDKAASTSLALAYASAGLLTMALMAAGRGRVSPELIGVALIAGYFLVAWPHVMRRFANRLLFDSDGEPLPEREHGRASDRGVSAFGYLLIAVSALTLAIQVSGALMVALHVGPGFGLFIFGVDTLLSIAASLAGIWAGLQLVAVSSSRKLAMLAYAALSIAPMVFDLVARGEGEGLPSQQRALVFALSAALPVLGTALVFRRPVRGAASEDTPPRGTPVRQD